MSPKVFMHSNHFLCMSIISASNYLNINFNTFLLFVFVNKPANITLVPSAQHHQDFSTDFSSTAVPSSN